ncbi:DddA-like double-stranded DNA deaminase toxin [Longispora fulva]|uniref:DddA-like double-stranded DNA deaminase toxin n=1 Tax=Longispora fulva TaxID=619741 RepID=UPI001E65D479|nr:DddA-like double-stranded DNA deaminase toxin [Longispora fulva]
MPTPATGSLRGGEWDRPTHIPAHVRASADASHFTPRSQGGLPRPTVAVFRGQELLSNRPDPAIAADLRWEPFPRPNDALYVHAETKVAAIMRSESLTEAEITIDNTVCGTRDFDRDKAWTCDKVLPSIMPPKSRLTVWATDDGGKMWARGVYVGTGERIRK